MGDWPGVGADVLVFAPAHNTGRKKDATHAFHPAAARFAEVHGVPSENVHRFDNRLPLAARASQVLDVLKGRRGLACVAFFCHGTAREIQAGFTTGARWGRHVSQLAAALAAVSNPGLIVPLYACSTASGKRKTAPGGDGGFADELRDALCVAGLTRCRVDAHTTVGHTTFNPHVRRFEGDESPVGGTGGRYLVEPASMLWGRWRRHLRRDDTFRYRFPFLEVRAIVAEIAGG